MLLSLIESHGVFQVLKLILKIVSWTRVQKEYIIETSNTVVTNSTEGGKCNCKMGIFKHWGCHLSLEFTVSNYF